MENTTETFVLTMYAELGQFKYMYFTLALIFYIFVIVANVTLIMIISVNSNLQEPMYVFLCSLFANEIYGSTSLMPCFMVHILAETHEISAFFCFLQIFNIHTYGTVEFGTLTVMAYDRYVCICNPLHYNIIITKRKVQIVILVIWIICFVEIGVLLSFTIHSKRCGNVINKVFCAHQLVVALSCSPDRTVSIIHDLVVGLVFTVGAPVSYISYTYAKILAVCLKGSKETKMKALETCTPHAVSLITFVFACFYSLISQRFDISSVPYPLCVVLSAYAMVIQPFQSPIIYGLKLSKIRHACKNLLTLKTSQLYIFHGECLNPHLSFLTEMNIHALKLQNVNIYARKNVLTFIVIVAYDYIILITSRAKTE
ncbi:olfactory receptor 52L1-like [Solea solea]|uniref:olfactory receptor 52L1-like n=1 Tax=Solea solea TaxID=90069 RepID=UPI00272AE08D|nr:olfactory receptor 52L1-like [Solea solea]